MIRILQISDSHLSPVKRHFLDQWEQTRLWVAKQQAALIIHCGDVSVDGAGNEADLAYGADLMAALPAPVLAVPGNHDVGEPWHPRQPVDAVRLDRWRKTFGDDTWFKDIGSWRLIGFNSMILSSDLSEEERQYRWLDQTMIAADGRRIAWFLHQPLFISDPDEGDNGYWSVRPSARARLLALLRRHDVALVSSGHLHRSHEQIVGGVRYVWAPSSAFVVGPKLQPGFPGEPALGAVIYEFDGFDVSIQRTAIEGLSTVWIDDLLHEVYPATTGLAQTNQQ